ncbi:hypothetical protein PR202_gb26817 [Eleusine coracana subsp. coracana]|uniref:DUF7731 domain-containing protein n=1 Tax=Eleusine coracana subsp. coracana TaxID=191504 RepID=A0AAV5FTK8_ELECO|nr:hypothetical protein PR202_gb26817 [Eleusine coracana subsp. coracana]
MASSPVSGRSRCWFVVACVFCSLVLCCKAADEAAAAAGFHGQKKDAVDIVGRALFCFNDPHVSARACPAGIIFKRRSYELALLATATMTHELIFFVLLFARAQIYSGCQDSLRLGPQGALNVPPASTDAFCGGACLEETELVLRCVDDVMANFRFYNGASVGDVREALGRGCGRTGLRGDFDVLHRIGYGDGYFYGGGSRSGRRPVWLDLMMLTAGAAILLRG